MIKNSLIWLRRNLRINDNKVICEAISTSEKLFFAFVFDSEVLKNFPDKNDRRLSFIVSALELIDIELKKYGSGLIILYGNPVIEIPKLVKKLNVDKVFADQDFEPYSLQRDSEILEKLQNQKVELSLILDHLVVHPKKIVKPDKKPYKVFTPYMKVLKSYISDQDYKEYKYSFDGKLSLIENLTFNKQEILKHAGYTYKEDELWQPKNGDKVVAEFINDKLQNYQHSRNYLDTGGTSKISPYLRFGIISIRKCFREALTHQIHDAWVTELIWREFYAYIMYHFPKSMELEFQEKYVGKIKWENNQSHLEAFCKGKTGFPLIDAAVRELITTGWMHNRSRMIVASFFSKNLFLDWRIGEKFFAKYLMDYELASNVGGWQWASSTGTDAQPYFRIFNPITQAENYDPEGIYIKKYVPELENVEPNDIFDGDKIASKYKIADYPEPIVNYKETRQYAISFFKDIK